MAHTFEITWHGEGTDTMRAHANSPEALEALRSLISADPDLIISSVTEFDQHGVAIVKRQASLAATHPLSISMTAVSARTAPAQACASGVGPSLCSRFPQCGHSSGRRALAA